MFDVGGLELIVIILAIIMLFGPKSIPKFMQQVGRGVRQFRKAQEELTQQIRDISADAAIQDALSMDAPVKPITVQPAEGISRSTTAPAVAQESDSASIEGNEPSALPDASENPSHIDPTTPAAS